MNVGVVSDYSELLQNDVCSDIDPDFLHVILTILLGILSTTGIIGNIFFLRSIWTNTIFRSARGLINQSCSNEEENKRFRVSKKLPRNSVVLLVNVSFCATAVLACALLRALIYRPIQIFGGFNLTALTATQCFLMESLKTISGVSLGFSFMCLVIERWLYLSGDRKPLPRSQCNKREGSGEYNKTFWVRLTISVTWIGGAGTVLTQLISRRNSSTRYCYCHIIIPYKSLPVWILSPAYCVTCSLCSLFYVLLWKRAKAAWENWGMNTAVYTISQRLRVLKTLRLTEFMLSSAVLHGVCWTISFGLSPVAHHRFIAHQTIGNVHLVTILIELPVVLHASFHPWICIWKARYLLTDFDLHQTTELSVKFVVDDAQENNSSRISTRQVQTSRQLYTHYETSPAEAQQIIEDIWSQTAHPPPRSL